MHNVLGTEIYGGWIRMTTTHMTILFQVPSMRITGFLLTQPTSSSMVPRVMRTVPLMLRQEAMRTKDNLMLELQFDDLILEGGADHVACQVNSTSTLKKSKALETACGGATDKRSFGTG
ncbi:hypothetical protein SprV_0501963900 [Sparganum proliferum]